MHRALEAMWNTVSIEVSLPFMLEAEVQSISYNHGVEDEYVAVAPGARWIVGGHFLTLCELCIRLWIW